MPTPPSCPEDYGRDIYRYLGGQRVRIGTVRTIRPYPAEEGDRTAFETRIERMVEQLLALYEVDSIDTDYERRAGRVVLCTITVRFVIPSASGATGLPFGVAAA